jgi:hypothetical protein
MEDVPWHLYAVANEIQMADAKELSSISLPMNYQYPAIFK